MHPEYHKLYTILPFRRVGMQQERKIRVMQDVAHLDF